MGDMVGGLGVIVTLFWIVLAILWMLVPFAIFGIKPRLDLIAHNQKLLIEQQQMTNKWLSESFKEQLDAKGLPRQ